MPDAKTPVGWNRDTGRFNEKAEKAKKPDPENPRKKVTLKKDMKKKGVRLKAKDIYDIARKGFAKDITFADKIEYRLYWIFLRTWVAFAFERKSKPWKDGRFELIEDLMREYAGSKDGKSFRKLVEKLIEELSGEHRRVKDKMDEMKGPGSSHRRRRLLMERSYLKGVIKELKRILESLSKD